MEVLLKAITTTQDHQEGRLVTLHDQGSLAKARLLLNKLASNPRAVMEDRRKANILLHTAASLGRPVASSLLLTQAASEVRRDNSHLNKAVSMVRLYRFRALARLRWDYRLRATTLIPLHTATQAETPMPSALL
jgi:hypothetical protein